MAVLVLYPGNTERNMAASLISENLLQTTRLYSRNRNYFRCFSLLSRVWRKHDTSSETGWMQKLHAELLEHAGDKRVLSADDWDQFKSDILRQKKRLSAANFDASVMSCLAHMQEHSLAKSFLEYLNRTGGQPSNVTLSYYMAQSQREDEIVACFNSIRAKGTTLLDGKTRDRIISGLCNTSLWKESFLLLEAQKDVCPPTAAALNAIAAAAFRYGDFETAWSTLRNLLASQMNVSSSTLASCVKVAKDMLQNGGVKDATELLSTLLDFISTGEVLPSEEVVTGLKSFYERLDDVSWKGTLVKIGRDGKCPACGCELEKDIIAEEDFERLRSAVISSVMKGSDVFINTTPQELESFEKFLRKTGPFDVVLDGLNVALQGAATRGERAAKLLEAVKHYALTERKKVLVVGRKHMASWPRQIVNSVKALATCYFTEDISEDDPFLLCAAVESGPETVVVSRDLLRNHKFRLRDVGLNAVFQKWQRLHQEVLYFAHGRIVILKPPQHRTSAHTVEGIGWHVPYDDGGALGPYAIRETWLCLHRRTEVPKVPKASEDEDVESKGASVL